MKKRVSVSIDQEIIEEVDELAGEKSISRSRAIEDLLEQKLREGDINKAVILAGGLSGNKGKPLEEVGGMPVIENTIKKLEDAGIKDVLICAGSITDEIFNLLGDGSEHGVSIRYLKEEEDLGTAGAVKLSEKYIDGPFLALSGDIYFDMDLSKIIEFHKKRDREATLLITAEELEKSKDKIVMDGDLIKSFKYLPEEVKTHYMNGGIYVLEPEIFEKLPDKGDLEEDVFPGLASEGKLNGFTFSDGWKHIE